MLQITLRTLGGGSFDQGISSQPTGTSLF
jgi:hypothetical protein